jgi:hypothetical protein
MAKEKQSPRLQRTLPKTSMSPFRYNLLLAAFTAMTTFIVCSLVNTAMFSSLLVNLVDVDEAKNSYVDNLPSLFTGQTMLGSPSYLEEEQQEEIVRPIRRPKGHIDYSDYTGPSTVFTKFEHPFPCFQGDPILMAKTPAHSGIMFQRPTKTGSTTLTGIILRLAHSRAKQERSVASQWCKHRTNHGTGIELDYYRREKTKSFLFSIIREPQARALSHVFHFDISALRLSEPTDEFLKSRLLLGMQHMYYFQQLGTRSYTKLTDPSKEIEVKRQMAREQGFDTDFPIRDHLASIGHNKTLQRAYDRLWRQTKQFGHNFTAHRVIADILEDYDLIMIMERMDESLVVLQMLLGLTTKEILYTRARSAGSFSNGFPDRPCIYILPSFVSPSMGKFFASDEWQQQVATDVEFYKAAHKSLDRTIDALGREEVEKRLEDLRAGLKLAAGHCEGRVRTMCSPAGEVVKLEDRTCYIWGEGCDHDCLDELEL